MSCSPEFCFCRWNVVREKQHLAECWTGVMRVMFGRKIWTRLCGHITWETWIILQKARRILWLVIFVKEYQGCTRITRLMEQSDGIMNRIRKFTQNPCRNWKQSWRMKRRLERLWWNYYLCIVIFTRIWMTAMSCASSTRTIAWFLSLTESTSLEVLLWNCYGICLLRQILSGTLMQRTFLFWWRQGKKKKVAWRRTQKRQFLLWNPYCGAGKQLFL